MSSGERSRIRTAFGVLSGRTSTEQIPVSSSMLPSVSAIIAFPEAEARSTAVKARPSADSSKVRSSGITVWPSSRPRIRTSSESGSPLNASSAMTNLGAGGACDPIRRHSASSSVAV